MNLRKRLLAKKQENGPLNLYRKPGALVLTLVILLIGGFLAIKLLMPLGERVNPDGYQVVYLVNGTTYFGKLKNTSGDYLVIEQPYTVQNVQPASEDENKTSQDATGQTQTTLLKVRDQVYGPEDVLSVRGDQVLFWQNLRSDSKVTQSIKAKQ